MKLDVELTLRRSLNLLLVGYCLWVGLALAEPIGVNEQFEYANLSPALEQLEETGSPLTLEQVRKATAWTATNTTPSLGFTSRAYWFRLSLFNSSPLDLRLLLGIAHSALDRVEFYQLYGDKIVNQLVTGDAGKFVQRPLDHRNFLFPLPIQARHQSQIYLRVQTTGALQLPLELFEPNRYFVADQAYLLQQGVYYGFMLVVVLYNLLMFFNSRDRLYCYFILYVLGFGLSQLSLSGLAFQYLWPEFPRWNQLSIPVCIALSAGFASLFVQRLFRPVKHGRADRLLFGFAAMAFVLLPFFPLLTYEWVIRLLVLLAVFTCLSLILFTAYLWLKYRQQGSLIAHLAWVILLAGMSLLVLNRFGIIPRNLLTEFSAQASSIVQILLLTYALAARVNREYQARLEAEFSARTSNQKFFQAEQQHALALEQAVQEKTAALHDALCQVSKLNMELARISITDSLTGLYNRRHFDHLLETELRRAAREERTISLILIDADHFKQVNDTYGHHIGDECLRQLATIILGPLRKPPDLAFRYGGEEIALLLPGTDAIGAEVVAEKIRALVESAEFAFADIHIKLTLSLGVGSVKPDQDSPAADLFEQADKALYRAKKAGRNRVERSDLAVTLETSVESPKSAQPFVDAPNKS